METNITRCGLVSARKQVCRDTHIVFFSGSSEVGGLYGEIGQYVNHSESKRYYQLKHFYTGEAGKIADKINKKIAEFKKQNMKVYESTLLGILNGL
jgi:hypothetical protein